MKRFLATTPENLDFQAGECAPRMAINLTVKVRYGGM
jgi:hypothetical protein